MLNDLLTDQLDLLLMTSRRAFRVSQDAWAGPSLEKIASSSVLGWHGGDLNGETGATGVVAAGGEHEDLVGDLIRFTRRLPSETRTVTVYILEAAEIPTDFSIARRCFFHLGLLANETLDVEVDVIEVALDE